MSNRLFHCVCGLGVLAQLALPCLAYALKTLGVPCASHQECASRRCDNRPGAGCVAQDGVGGASEFCTTHQQCHSQVCVGVRVGSDGRLVGGRCTGVNQPLGAPCASHQECASRRCDNRPGAGCVAQDGAAPGGAVCTTHQQCQSQCCPGVAVASDRTIVPGHCASNSLVLGRPCICHQECASNRCDNRPGAGCVAQDGSAPGGAACTTHQQCVSGCCAGVGIVDGRVVVGHCRPSSGNLVLGDPCVCASECASRNCDDRTGAGCVPQNHRGEPREICTDHAQCRSGYCDVAKGIRGTCTTYDLPPGARCHIASECKSQICTNHTCTAPRPPATICGTGKSLQYYTFCATCAGGARYGYEGWACSKEEADAAAKRQYSDCAITSGRCNW